jgi:hypothetical protein
MLTKSAKSATMNFVVFSFLFSSLKFYYIYVPDKSNLNGRTSPSKNEKAKIFARSSRLQTIHATINIERVICFRAFLFLVFHCSDDEEENVGHIDCPTVDTLFIERSVATWAYSFASQFR